ncbi:hypothetical protein Gogos_004455, partial [Gossypium gossypioides]|nr:hypothetical protein [Gossypium gossypioides]
MHVKFIFCKTLLVLSAVYFGCWRAMSSQIRLSCMNSRDPGSASADLLK